MIQKNLTGCPEQNMAVMKIVLQQMNQMQQHDNLQSEK